MVAKFHFTKMHGLGNNYIYVNQFEEKLPEEKLSELAVQVSNPYTGIGSDGMILICPSKVAPVKMRIFNNDGSEGKNCGNGLRCVAKYVYEHKMVTTPVFQIETLSGLVTAQLQIKNDTVTSVKVDMGQPKLLREQVPMKGQHGEKVVNEPFEIQGERLTITGVSMGNPHGVFFVDDIKEAPLHTLGPIIEKDDRFPEGINVEFIEVVNSTELHFRVWERGSGITQACGTGACAAAVAAILNGKANKDEDIVVHLAGGDLTIKWSSDGKVWMTGPAEVICEGSYFIK